MKNSIASVVFLFFLCHLFTHALTNKDTLVMTAQDSTLIYSMELKEVIVSPNGVFSVNDADRRAKLILKRRIFKVYPYAKLTADKLMQMDATMAKLKTDLEKRKYFKIVENYLEQEFEPRLKKLSRKDGQILVKLINRQTGVSTYNLIKEYKSGWKAFWANSTARLFSINLKSEYKPYEVNEDYQIESLLNAAFDLGQLPKQEAAKPVDFTKLSVYWANKQKEEAATEIK